MSDLLEQLLATEAAGSPARSPLRAAAIDVLQRTGLPREREEAWKYTSLKPLRARQFQPIAPVAHLSPDQLASLELPDLDGPRAVLVNGRLVAAQSRLEGLPEGLSVTAMDLSDATAAALQGGNLRDLPETSARGFETLNSACNEQVLHIRVAAGAQIPSPLQLCLATVESGSAFAVHPRVIVELGEGSSLRLVEQWQGFGAPVLSNAVVHVRIGERASLRHLRLQEEGAGAQLVQSSETVLAAGAFLRRYDIELGAAFARHDLRIRLDGEDSACESYGVFALRGRQHVDTHLDVRHGVARTRSLARWRGVADERSRAVFDGYIEVKAGADGSDAQLSSRNLLLSPHAEIDTRPVLEIHADDIKASHGATVGQLDERALFYLRSRGLPAGEARRLLTYAFCREAFDQMQLAGLREHLAARLVEHLPEALSRREEGHA